MATFAPTFLLPQVWVPGTPLMLYHIQSNLRLYLSCEKNKNKQKEARFGPFFIIKRLATAPLGVVNGPWRKLRLWVGPSGKLLLVIMTNPKINNASRVCQHSVLGLSGCSSPFTRELKSCEQNRSKLKQRNRAAALLEEWLTWKPVGSCFKYAFRVSMMCKVTSLVWHNSRVVNNCWNRVVKIKSFEF